LAAIDDVGKMKIKESNAQVKLKFVTSLLEFVTRYRYWQWWRHGEV
jgi:hypothetical protein